MHNLTESAASIDATLKDLADTVIDVASGLQFIDDEIVAIRRRAFPAPRLRATGAWPWAPGTAAQGFLGARWNRRDGNVYGSALLRGVQAVNSPIRGGDDSQAQISVPSGARRS